MDSGRPVPDHGPGAVDTAASGYRSGRRFAAFGAGFVLVATALAALASHAAPEHLRALLAAAAMFGLCGCGLLGLHAAGPLLGARWPIALGCLLFGASVLLGAWLGFRAVLAPAGGLLMMGGWLLAGIALLRRPV